MAFVSRPYQYPHDAPRIAAFLSHIRRDVHHVHTLHRGDMVWQMFHMLADKSPSDLVQLWENSAGEIAAFVLLYPAFGAFDLQIDCQYRTSAFVAELLDWVEQRLATAQRSTLVHHHDATQQALLRERGYVPSGEWQYMEQSLASIPAQTALRQGFSLRSVAGDHEADERAAVLGAAFGAPSFAERYRRFMHAPGYNSELDLVAIDAAGRFVAFALCWADPITKVAQFEPVGTAPVARRQGLGRALLLEGLRRMRQHGAERAIVIAEAAEEAACALYTAVGFERRWGLTWYATP